MRSRTSSRRRPRRQPNDPVQLSAGGDVAQAVRAIAADPGARFIAGGTDLVDLMKYDVERPTRLIDIGKVPELGVIEETQAADCVSVPW